MHYCEGMDYLEERDSPGRDPNVLLADLLRVNWANIKSHCIVRLPIDSPCCPPSVTYSGWRIYFQNY